MKRNRTRIIAAFIALAVCATQLGTAHETDQYTLPFGREFADLRFYFSEHFHDAIKGAVDKTNARIRESLVDGQPTSETQRLQSPDQIAVAVVGEFPPFFTYLDQLELLLRRSDFASRYPGLVTAYLPTLGIYQHWVLALDPTKFSRWWRGSTVMIDGTLLGTDKILHFVHVGCLYFYTYRSALAGGATEEEAIRRAIDLGNGANLMSERAFLGAFSTGVVSNADLAVNFIGLKFFRNLTEPVSLRGTMQPPLLERDGEFLRLASHVNAHSDFFKVFVSDHWNEVFTPNEYQWGMGGFVEESIAVHCDDLLDWYRTEDGRRMSRADFVRKLEETRTYFGENYGNNNDPTQLVSLLTACFDKSSPAPPPAAGSFDRFGRSALWRDARAGRLEAVRSELDSGGDPRIADVDGETPLHAAARAGHAQIIELLVSRRASVDVRSRLGLTPLHLAARENNVESVRALLAVKADVNARDAFGCTPLHDAAARNADVILRMLLDAGGEAAARDDRGVTPLHRAARSGAVRAASLLRSAGAATSDVNTFGHTPLDEARAQGYHGLRSMLETPGPSVHADVARDGTRR